MIATSLVTGVMGVAGITTASASINNFYVQPAVDGGSDGGVATPGTLGGNNCELAANPCATIQHALVEEANLTPGAVGSVINLAVGTYNQANDDMFAALTDSSITDSNNNVTITGAIPKGKTKKAKAKVSVVSPQSCAALGTVPAAGGGPDAGDQAVVAFGGATAATSLNGITVENMTLAPNVGQAACPNYIAGVINTQGEENAVVGVTFETNATFGILTDDDASSSVISNVLTPVLCTTTVTGPNTGLNAGWTTPMTLLVKTVPKCAKFLESGHAAANGFYINGVAYCITYSATKNNLVITGTPSAGSGCATGGTPIEHSEGVEVAKGATVIFNTSGAPFTQWGIACNSPVSSAAFATADETTDCAISDNTVAGGGTVYGDYSGIGTALNYTAPGPAPQFPEYVNFQDCNGLGPAGIIATDGGMANLDGNSVSDITDSISDCPEPGESLSDGIGIALIPSVTTGCSAGTSVVGVDNIPNPATGAGNKLGTTSADDVGIQVAGNGVSTCTTKSPSYEVNGNSVTSANDDGIELQALGLQNDPAITGISSKADSANLDTCMMNNSVSVTTGAGFLLEGVESQCIGGVLGSEGNTSSGSGIGMVLAPCSTSANSGDYPGCPNEGTFGEVPSVDNTVQNNTLDNSELYGLFLVGSYQPEEIASQIPVFAEAFASSDGNTINANTFTGNGAGAPFVDGANVMDGDGWGGGCVSEAGDCTTTGVGPLIFDGPNATFSSTYPGSATISLNVCNTGANSEVLPRGTQITFYGGAPGVDNGDSGTFFVTQDAVITGNNCSAPPTFTPYDLQIQALNPEQVGTDSSPSGQPYVLGQGDEVFVNANGAAAATSNIYGHSGKSNSCTPVGTPGPPAVPNIFGQTNPPYTQYSTTLQASSGGVNATYIAC